MAYFIIGFLVLTGIFFMRWNVVIGGQLFSKSLSGFTSFNAVYSGMEGYLMTAVWLILPLGILTFLLWLMPPWKKLNANE
jgi:predicted membrane protein